MQSRQYSTPRLSKFSTPNKRVRLVEPDSDQVVSHSLDRLQSLLIEEANVEEILQEIASTARYYQRRQKILRDKIFLYRGVLAPVRQLSIEVLMIIFEFLSALSPDDIKHVGLVCVQWRLATLETSAVWSHIIVARECPAFEQKVTLFSERAGARLLKVSYSQSVDPTRPWRAWAKLLLKASQWTTLALTFDDCLSASLRIPMLAASPVLQELSVTIRHQSPSPNFEGKYGFDVCDAGKTPSLRSLILSTHVLPQGCAWFTNLTSLHIIDTFAGLTIPRGLFEPMHGNHILELLRACPKLEEFFLEAEKSSQCFISREASTSGPPVRLPNLRRLCLTCHYSVGYYLLEYIMSTKNLEDVTLRLLPQFQSVTEARLTNTACTFFIASPKIRSLSLYGLSYPTIMVAIQSGLQELQELRLIHVSGKYSNPQHEGVCGLEAITGCLLRDVDKFNDDDAWHAPKLTHLFIDAHHDDVPFELLRKAIRVRNSANRLRGQPSRIQSLQVNGQNLLDDAAPGGIVKYRRIKRFRNSE